MIDMLKVIGLYRYPLKGAQGESLQAVDVEADGVRGDRIWACLDGEDGTVGSPKHPRRWGGLLGIGTELRDDTLALRVPEGVVIAGSGEADAALSALLDRKVQLSRQVPAQARLHRLLPDDPGMVPEWMGDVGAGQETVSEFAGGATRFVDFGAVHIVTTGALAGLGREMGDVEVAAARFRPNLVLDAEGDPEPGQVLRFGDVTLRVITRTPRCVVPGISHGELPADPALLRTLARHHRVTLPGLGRAACFGTYAEVLTPGAIRVGEQAL